MHADGAGTKSSKACLLERNRRYIRLERIAQDALIMNIDDLLCVGAVENILVSSTMVNKFVIECISSIINGTEELLSELRGLGFNSLNGWRDCYVGDLVRTIIVDST